MRSSFGGMVRRVWDGTGMLADQRRRDIVVRLQRTGQAKTRELADIYGVSEVTIRSDLDALSAKKRLVKTHGGAIALPADSTVPAFEQRMGRNMEAKRRIAAAAAQEIVDNQSIVFDGGSTLMQVAMQMPPVSNVVVATTGMNIAQHIMHRPGLDVHMIGGRVYPETASTLVSEHDRAVGGLVAHQAFLGAHGIDQALDVVDLFEDVARTKRNLVRIARRIILLVDSSKWDCEATSKAFPLSRIDLVITDSATPKHIRGRLRKAGVEALYV